MLKNRTLLPPQKNLDFIIEDYDVPEPYEVKWKVLNRGDEAKRRDMIHGQIISTSRAGRG